MSKVITENNQIIKNDSETYASSLADKLRSGLWIFGIPSWLFGIGDRTVAAFADGYLSAIEVLQLCMAFFFFVSWLCLKPEDSLSGEGLILPAYKPHRSNLALHEAELQQAKPRMVELENQHLISQEYTLPFPHLCQIYHLLNLKHLEQVHSFSLSNLRVIKVNDFQPTNDGGTIRFQTVLDSPMNALRIWRQPIVEAELTLHNPHTVELKIPVYGSKHIIVLFNVVPLGDTEHKLFIDIYSNLKWPKPLMQVALHFASCLTLFEDLPYLQKLAERNISRLIQMNRVSDHETMWLFKRFVDLYGSRTLQPSIAVEPIV